MDKIPQEILERIKNIKNKRAKIVVEHILKHGSITTQELLDHGYKHAPRAARDVREEGIPLKTERVTSPAGERMARYLFDDFSKFEQGKIGGRKVFSKGLKARLYADNLEKCYVCSTKYEERYLQVDHRVPYEVAGDNGNLDENPKKFMLLCSSCNRSKSWSCEHCENWIQSKDTKVCETCYWCQPQNYQHVALKQQRRTELIWEGETSIKDHDMYYEIAKAKSQTLPEYIKEVMATYGKK